MIPSITIYVRHAADCPHADDETWKRRNCPKHLRWTWQGKQMRRRAKTRSWAGAERAKRTLEMQYESAVADKLAQNDEPVTIEQAVAAFLADKTGAQTADNTISKYKLTLSRLQGFCTAEGLFFVPEITLEHLSTWRATWTRYYGSSLAEGRSPVLVRSSCHALPGAGVRTQCTVTWIWRRCEMY